MTLNVQIKFLRQEKKIAKIYLRKIVTGNFKIKIHVNKVIVFLND